MLSKLFRSNDEILLSTLVSTKNNTVHHFFWSKDIIVKSADSESQVPVLQII